MSSIRLLPMGLRDPCGCRGTSCPVSTPLISDPSAAQHCTQQQRQRSHALRQQQLGMRRQRGQRSAVERSDGDGDGGGVAAGCSAALHAPHLIHEMSAFDDTKKTHHTL
eukprot:6172413-Pleurochrysis_carterae.AAC.3